MSLADALITFVSVFVAALLAFYLDGLRERRAARAWVQEYLGFWRGVLDRSRGDRAANAEGLTRISTALDIWLSEGTAEPVWSDVDTVNVNTAVSFTPMLLSAGAGVVPKELVGQMFVADANAPALLRRSEYVSRLFDAYVLPLVLARVTSLAPEQRRAVEKYRDEFAGLCDQMQHHLDLLDDICAGLVGLGV